MRRRSFVGGSSIAALYGAAVGCRQHAPPPEAIALPPPAEVSELGGFDLGEQVLDEGTSEYNHVVITQDGSVRTMYFIVDGRRSPESIHDLEHPRALGWSVFRTMMAALFVQPEIKRMLLIGTGGGQVTNYLYHRFPALQIDAVDICPEVSRLAKKYFGIPDDPRYRLHVGDGRLFVEQVPLDVGWDLIVLDAFRGKSVPAHLRTQEFYRAMSQRLAPGGVLVANVHRRSLRYPVDRTTMASVFPHNYRFVSEDGIQTSVVASQTAVSREMMRANAAALQSRFDFDVSALVERYAPERDWEDTEVLRDDFEQLKTGIDRHNRSCSPQCDGDPGRG